MQTSKHSMTPCRSSLSLRLLVFLLATTGLWACSPAVANRGSSTPLLPGKPAVPVGGAATQTVGGLLDPCSILTTAEVATILGETAEPIVDHEIDDAECYYEPLHNTNDRSVVVEFTKVTPASATFAARVQFFRNEGAQPLPGLGTDAYARGGKVLASNAHLILFVSVTDKTAEPQRLQDQARALMQTVLSRVS
ncbi:MAG: hypothetical protein NVS2B7_34860 [Herpetosiphon sp.]